MKRPFNYKPTEEMLEILIALDKINGWEILAPGQYRISHKLDIYPKSQKYFYIPKQEWGTYEDLESLIFNLKYGLPANYKSRSFAPLLY